MHRVLLPTILAFALAGCSDDKPDEPKPAVVEATSTPTPTPNVDASTESLKAVQTPAPTPDPQELMARETYQNLTNACSANDIASAIRCRDTLVTLGKEEWLLPFKQSGWPQKIDSALSQERANASAEKPFLDAQLPKLSTTRDALMKMYELHANAPLSGAPPTQLVALARHASSLWQPMPPNKHPTARLSALYHEISDAVPQMQALPAHTTAAQVYQTAATLNQIIVKLRNLCPTGAASVEPIDFNKVMPKPVYVAGDEIASLHEAARKGIRRHFDMLDKLEQAARVENIGRRRGEDNHFINEAREEVQKIYDFMDGVSRLHVNDPTADAQFEEKRSRATAFKQIMADYYRILGEDNTMAITKANLMARERLVDMGYDFTGEE